VSEVRATPWTGQWDLTGNHFISFPAIDPRTGAVHALNVLHRGLNGLIEWRGERTGAEPLLAPELAVDGAPVPLVDVVWERVERWMPTFSCETSGLRLQATLCAPGGQDPALRGAVYRFQIENRGDVERSVVLALRGVLRWAIHTVASERPLAGDNRATIGEAVRGLALESGMPGAGAGFAITASGDEVRYLAGTGDAPTAELAPGTEVAAPNGVPLSFRVVRTVRLGPRGRATVSFFLGVGPERDGALRAAAYLRELGADEVIRIGRLELARITRRVKDARLGTVFNRNLLFNYFFAVGRAIDDDRYYPLSSRATDGHRGAAVSEREALLWTVPALTIADPELAREVLLRTFEQYSHRPGQRARYLDGGILAPGFALDQFCAYVLALDRYTAETRDDSLRHDGLIQDVLRELDAALLDRLHPEVTLASTWVLPSGERAQLPYTTYGNVMAWALADALERLWVPRDDQDRPRLSGAADEIASAIWRYCTAEVAGLRVLAWATDLEGEIAIYDDPAGSLALLPSLGFCDPDDPIWVNTMELLRSDEYRFWLGQAPAPGLARAARPDEAHLAALCADLLTDVHRDRALDTLRRLELDADLACETYNPETARPRAGRRHAAVAGFLAWSLWHALHE